MGKTTNDRIEDYRNYLIDNERSAATVSKYLAAVRDLFLFLGEKTPERRDILDYREHLLKTRTAKTVNAALSAINGFFLFAGREDLTVHYLKIQHKAFADEKKELDMREYRRLLKAAKDAGDGRTWLLLQTLAGTGIRISEHVYITVEAACESAKQNPGIAVKFSVTPKWLKLLIGFKQQEKIAVDYFDTETLEIVSTEMYIDGYKAVRKADTSYKGLWEVSFTLKEF
ncbi:MAG: site-specific integrase [Clostridiales bacterium]|nr:site-specific integrase [Clostridiales bacterium]